MPSRRVSRGPRRKLIWARMTPAITSVQNNAAATQYNESQDLLQTFRTQMGITAGPVGLTVMRMRFHLNTGIWTTPLIGPAILGVRVMDLNEAVAAETDATPYSPSTDPHADWMCFEPFGPKATSGTNAGFVDHTIDVRSMRKIDELGQTLVAIISTVPPIGGAAGASQGIVLTSSVLLALP